MVTGSLGEGQLRVGLERVMEEFTHAAVAMLQCLLQNALSAFNLLYVFKT